MPPDQDLRAAAPISLRTGDEFDLQNPLRTSPSYRKVTGNHRRCSSRNKLDVGASHHASVLLIDARSEYMRAPGRSMPRAIIPPSSFPSLRDEDSSLAIGSGRGPRQGIECGNAGLAHGPWCHTSGTRPRPSAIPSTNIPPPSRGALRNNRNVRRGHLYPFGDPRRDMRRCPAWAGPVSKRATRGEWLERVRSWRASGQGLGVDRDQEGRAHSAAPRCRRLPPALPRCLRRPT